MKKIVFFDVDGTLVAKSNKVKSSTMAAIQELKKQNILPVLATGRSPMLLKDVAEKLDIDSYISMNGQYIVLEGEVFHANPIKDELIPEVIDFAVNNKNGIMLCTDSAIISSSTYQNADTSKTIKTLKRLTSVVPKSVQQKIVVNRMKKPPKTKDYKNKVIYQMILEAPIGEEEVYEKAFKDLNFTRSNKYMLDVINKGTSKASGIKKVLKHYGVDRTDAFAFGDHLNDLEMLQYVGMGVAMGNALPEVKEVSDMVTDTVKNDGILKGLQKLKLI